jgi:hypothetical protein
LTKNLLAFGLVTMGLLSGTAKAGFPENDLWKEDCLWCEGAGTTEQEFNAEIDKVVNKYRAAVAGHGASLKVNRLWTNSTVNASAEQQGKTWILNMYGGLARRPEVTLDGFALVVCHELGHHLGGFPLYGSGEWAASEGQSDMFATQACGRLVWKSEASVNATFRDTVGQIEKSKCDQTWKSQGNRDLCYRQAAAGQSLANLLASLNGAQTPSFSTPDRQVVSRTQVSHPRAQCRLDTYLAGAVCGKTFPFNVIPKTKSADAACQVSIGKRPTCWYAP